MSELHAITLTREDARGDVVFVHGLGGDWRDTWAADPSRPDTFWPQWLATDLPEVNIWSLAYEASPSGWLGASMPLVDRATDVLGSLEAYGLGERPLVFVAHSLGGLLVKQVLRTGEGYGEARWQQIIQQVRGIAFLATPHTGVRLADYVGALRVVLRASVSVRELGASAPALRDLNLWFRDGTKRLQVDNLVFFETRNTRGVRVVDEASADPGLASVVPRAVDADHVTIAKPASPVALVPKLARKFVRRCLVAPGQRGTAGTTRVSPRDRNVQLIHIQERIFELFERHSIDMPTMAEIIGVSLPTLKGDALLEHLDNETIVRLSKTFFVSRSWLLGKNTYSSETVGRWYKSPYEVIRRIRKLHGEGSNPRIYFIKSKSMDPEEAIQREIPAASVTVIISSSNKTQSGQDFVSFERWDDQPFDYQKSRLDFLALVRVCWLKTTSKLSERMEKHCDADWQMAYDLHCALSWSALEINDQAFEAYRRGELFPAEIVVPHYSHLSWYRDLQGWNPEDYVDDDPSYVCSKIKPEYEFIVERADEILKTLVHDVRVERWKP